MRKKKHEGWTITNFQLATTFIDTKTLLIYRKRRGEERAKKRKEQHYAIEGMLLSGM